MRSFKSFFLFVMDALLIISKTNKDYKVKSFRGGQDDLKKAV